MKKIRVGTDCSGIEAPIQALRKLKIPFSHEWSKILFEDITKPRKLPKTDLYVCGFPCQPFSTAGKGKGFNDIRGTIFYYCIKTIKKTKPTIFILENVKGLLSNNQGKTWETIQSVLATLKEYNIYHKILNTRHYGIPHNRERIFIVGIRKDKQKREFHWPKPIKCKDIHSYIDYSVRKKDNPFQSCRHKIKKSKGIFIESLLININSSNSYKQYCPSLMCTNTLWCKPLHRYATIKEKLSLQGFPKTFKQVVSDTQLSKQIGNSMSVNVLIKLINEILKCIK